MNRLATSRVLVICAVAAAWCLCAGCQPRNQYAQNTNPPPTSSWGEKYSYSYEPPEKMGPASVAATIVVVNPSYREAESALQAQVYSKVGKGFSVSMGVDMDKVIIAKGMTVKGPYASLEDITYSDKKGSDLTLCPKLFLTTKVDYIGDWRITRYVQGGVEEFRKERSFAMKINGWISFVMQEPLSAEKMWIKKLELDEMAMEGIESYKATPQYSTQEDPCMGPGGGGRILTGYDVGELVYDGKADAIADALKQVYPTVMEKLWTYLDANEILSLKEKTEEIRRLKRY
jgi:hypothetical protein